MGRGGNMKRIILHDSSGETLMLDNVWPVGSIYMSVISTNPSTLFGGTWQQLQNRFLLGAGSSYSNGATGGEATHKLTVNEMPSHQHDRVLVDGNVNFPLGSETGSQGPANRRKMTTTSDTYGFFAKTNFSGGVRRTTICRRISSCICGRGLRNLRKEAA